MAFDRGAWIRVPYPPPAAGKRSEMGYRCRGGLRRRRGGMRGARPTGNGKGVGSHSGWHINPRQVTTLDSAQSDDDEPDFTSPIGLEDETQVLNRCLRLVGLEDAVASVLPVSCVILRHRRDPLHPPVESSQ